MTIESTLVNELELLETCIKDLEFYISLLNKPEQYPILLKKRNELFGYRQAYETYRSALMKLQEVI